MSFRQYDNHGLLYAHDGRPQNSLNSRSSVLQKVRCLVIMVLTPTQYMRRWARAVGMPASRLQAPPTKHGKSEDFTRHSSARHQDVAPKIFQTLSMYSVTISRAIISHFLLGVSYASFMVSCRTSLAAALNGMIFRLGPCSVAPFTHQTKRGIANGCKWKHPEVKLSPSCFWRMNKQRRFRVLCFLNTHSSGSWNNEQAPLAQMLVARRS